MSTGDASCTHKVVLVNQGFDVKKRVKIVGQAKDSDDFEIDFVPDEIPIGSSLIEMDITKLGLRIFIYQVLWTDSSNAGRGTPPFEIERGSYYVDVGCEWRVIKGKVDYEYPMSTSVLAPSANSERG